MNNYKRFFQLHRQEKPLVIANAWNVKSAQIIENCGYEAIATSSAAIADSLGYADGEKIPFTELLYVVQRMVSATRIPLSVDLERGYTDNLTELNDHVQKLIDIGVAGINLEDAEGEEIYLKKLCSIKGYLRQSKQQLFINARTDGFLQKSEAPLETTLKRAKLYGDAGADGLFVTGLQDMAVLRKITSSVTLPVNVVGVPKFSSVSALSECGVKRISMAVFLYRTTYDQMEKTVRDIKTEQSFTPLYKDLS